MKEFQLSIIYLSQYLDNTLLNKMFLFNKNLEYKYIIEQNTIL